jgi:hypothetical protein
MKQQPYIILLCLLFASGCSVTHYISEGVVSSGDRTDEIALLLKEEDNHIRLESCGGLLYQPMLVANNNAPIQLSATDEEYVTHEIDQHGRLNKLTSPIKSRDSIKPCIAVWTNNKPATRADFTVSKVPVIYFMCTPENTNLSHKYANTGYYTLGPIRVEKHWHFPTQTVPSPKHCDK